MSHVLNVLHPCQCLSFAYARTGFAYAHILSYEDLTLAYAHHSFSYAAPLQGAVAYHEHWALNVAQITLFPQKIVLVCRSQKNQIAFYTLIKKQFFHTFQFPRRWAMRGPSSL